MNAIAAPLNAPVLPTAVPITADPARMPARTYWTVLAMAGLPLGIVWDISWHISIGRDTFWTPAHILIQLGGVVPALIFFWQAWQTTFRGTPAERAGAISLFGIHAPLGAWVTMWGALAMVTSAPFDDWWHNTYGLDVKIVSPPHSVLGLGMLVVAIGVLLNVLSWQNRLVGTSQAKAAALLFTVAAGLMVTMKSVFATEYVWPNNQHSSIFYQVIAHMFPFLLLIPARVANIRWAATIAASIYTALTLFMVWVLPLFPAQPKLAPIYNPVTHMVPPPFPLLILVPAIAIDVLMLVWGRKLTAYRRWKALFMDWLLAMAIGILFIGLMLAVQWPFSKFLLSSASDNWFFAGNRVWPYYSRLGDWTHQFWTWKQPFSLRGLAVAGGVAIISARVGLWCGRWMLKVRR
ncbi:MAG TPA: hypothetical protein VJ063_14705 [Verrucomicrobiae bacterium]|nr:hypothetical protein [Verrucomicrobiae bacterium]